MDALVLLALAVAPGLTIMILVYWQDKFERESIKLMFTSFLLGMVAIVPAIFLEEAGMSWIPPVNETFRIFIVAFVVVGCSEEICKYLMLRLHAYRKSEFNEPFDGITYSVMVAMGFATLENIFYVYQYGMGNALLRMFTAVPAHATFGIMMGYYAGLAKFRNNSLQLHLQGLLAAIMLHGAYDFFLMLNSIPLIALGALVSLILGIRYSLKAIQLHQQISPFNMK